MAEPIVSHTEWDRFSWPRIEAKLSGKWKRPQKVSLLEEETARSEWQQKKQRLRNGECWNGSGHDSPVAGQRFCRSCMNKVSATRHVKKATP